VQQLNEGKMKKPECKCFENGYGTEMAIGAASRMGMGFGSVMREVGICPEAGYTAMIYTFVMIARGMASEHAKSAINCDREFETIMSTLIADMRTVDAELEMSLANRETKQ
jgi:hypothetical protein